MRKRLILAVLPLLVAARGATAAVAVTNAVYQVPGDPGSEADQRFMIGDLALAGDKGARHLSFRLPEDLTGDKPTVVELKESRAAPGATFVAFGGDDASEVATCDFAARSVVCLVHYKARAPADLTRFLNGKYHGAAVVRQKLAIALRYQNEPAGILSFDLAK